MKSSNISQHTKGEWHLSHAPARPKTIGSGIIGRIFKSIKTQNTIGGNIVANAYGNTAEEAEANAKRIVQAVNILSKIENLLSEYANSDEGNVHPDSRKYCQGLEQLLKQSE